MIEQGLDQDMLAMAKEELNELKATQQKIVEELRISLIPKDTK